MSFFPMTRANLFASLTEPLRGALTTAKQNRSVLASSRFCSAFQARRDRVLLYARVATKAILAVASSHRVRRSFITKESWSALG